HLKWTESFHNLMQDIDGVKLFKEYLKGDNFSDKLIDFHFACLGFKIKVSTDPENFSNLAKSIYKKFIKGDSMPLKSSVKKQIVEALKTKNINESIFDVAQAEIDLILKTNHYPAFLTSDIFIKFAETELENSKI
ncbi:hypothetical protein HELRODRAFT_136825, partial [Helobdella robusta]|uniref:RGS domain-containing protein n=1 Tax=Helobdella robusta TaxID=6412 RepID=T1EIG2_HELRO